MPISSSVKPTFNSKNCRLTALLLITPLFFFGQSLTGLWVGSVHNDSATVRKDQSFEIALTEYRGKVYGYSRSEFIVNDTLYYIVKRVKGTIEGDVCEVSDDEIIAFNFRGKLDKGIKVTSTFRRNKSDSTWYLEGTWKTNATKKYYSITGKVGLEVERDLTSSKIFPHLEELNLTKDIAFYKERAEGIPIVKIARPEKIKTEYSTAPEIPSSAADIAIAKPKLDRAESEPPVVKAGPVTTAPSETATNDVVATNTTDDLAAVKKTENNLPKTDTKNIPSSTTGIKPAAVETKLAVNKPTVQEVVKSNEASTVSVDIKAPAGNKENNITGSKTAIPAEEKVIAKNIQPASTNNNNQTAANTKPVVKATNTPAKENNSVVQANTNKKPALPAATPVISPAQQTQTKEDNSLSGVKAIEKRETASTPVIEKLPVPAIDLIQKASVISGRKSEFSQAVNFKSDSLELSLYDNGEIDGDTVSIFLNGEVIMAKQGLKASAIKKTIYITPGNEDFTLVLFADNLGKYPPNTGLLVVHDGEDVYNLRFSSDFQKSTGILFRRQK
jgi:hypothetical protein